jgi:hypothetical protein
MSGWLNLFPDELRPGDVWSEGQKIVTTEKIETAAAWRIHLSRGRCVMDWPDKAPRRIYRPEHEIDGSTP